MTSVVNFNPTADDYSRYRAGLPDSFFDRIRARGVGLAGQRVLDLGTGTATLARGLARRGAQVVGLDIAAELMRAAQKLDGGDKVSFVRSRAEKTPFADESFDLVSAVQCWHWFDRAATLVEVRRLLKPGATFMIATFDWLPAPGNVVEVTEDLIDRTNPDQAKPHIRFAQGTGIYPQWLIDMQSGGFTSIESFSFDVEVPYTHESWRGRIRASQGVGASLPLDVVRAFDTELARILRERFPEDALSIPHRVFVALSRR